MMRTVLVAVAIAGCGKKPHVAPAPLGRVTPELIDQFKRTCAGRVGPGSDPLTCELNPPYVEGHRYSVTYWERDGRIELIHIEGMHSDAELDATFARALVPLLPPENVGTLRASLHTMPLNFKTTTMGAEGDFPNLPNTSVRWSRLPYDDGSGTVSKGVMWLFPAGPANSTE